MNNFGKNLLLWVIIGALLVVLFNMFQHPGQKGGQSTIPFSEFLSEISKGQVREVTIKGHSIEGVYSDNRSFRTYAPDDPNLVERLNKHGG